MFQNYEFYVPKVLYSETKFEGSIFGRFYIPMVLCSEKVEGFIFRRFYVPKFQIVHPIESGVSVRRLTWLMDIGIRD